MKKNSVGIILGLLFLIVGAGYLAEVLGFIEEFTIFFDGWWTLFIIVPCFCGLVGRDGGKVGYLIGIAVGVFFLLSAQGVLNSNKLWALLLAVICVLIGVNLLLPKRKQESESGDTDAHTDRFDRGQNETVTHTAEQKAERFADAEVVSEGAFAETQVTAAEPAEQYHENEQRYENAGDAEKIVCSAVFAGRDIRVDNSYFNGADLSALFGGIDLNLKNAMIQKNVTIEVKAVFGGIDILMPPNVRVVVDVTPILGGVENGTSAPLGADENTPTVFIKGTCMFGGLEVK